MSTLQAHIHVTQDVIPSSTSVILHISCTCMFMYVRIPCHSHVQSVSVVPVLATVGMVELDAVVHLRSFHSSVRVQVRWMRSMTSTHAQTSCGGVTARTRSNMASTAAEVCSHRPGTPSELLFSPAVPHVHPDDDML